MVKVNIIRDERYTDYDMQEIDHSDRWVDAGPLYVDEEFYAQFIEARKLYDMFQDQLDEKYERFKNEQKD